MDSFIPDYKFAKVTAKTDTSIGGIKDDISNQQHIDRVNGYVNGEVIANSHSRKLRRDQFLSLFSAHNKSTLRFNVAAIKKKSEN